MARSKGSTSPNNLYGRQGGGWTESTGDVAEALRAIATARKKGQADGTWPTHDLSEAFRPGPEGEGYDWPGARRMAEARQRAGIELTDIDREALAR